MNDVIAYLEENRSRFLDELKQWLRIASISPGSPDPKALETAAEWGAERLRQAGLDEVKLLRSPGNNAVVWGRKTAGPDKPTVLFYGHYDVMPPDPMEQWQSPPFEPDLRDGALYGRGTADDKGQVMMHIAAVEAYLRTRGELPVNVVFAIEGEEEMGSEGLEKLLDSEHDLFKADIAVISDSPFFAAGVPSVCYGLRGIAAAEIIVRGPDRDLHSGNYGGAVANPAEMLARIVNDLKDRNGTILIPGFYDDVRPLGDDEREAFAGLPHDDAEFCRSLGIPAVYGEEGYSTLERIWARPSMEINGIVGGFTGSGSKTIVPSDALVKLSMRLVPNQDPADVLDKLEKYVKGIAPTGVEVTVEKGHWGRPFLMPPDHDALHAAKRAMGKAFGSEVALIRDGASIPIVNSLAEKLDAACLLVGVDVPEGKIHSPNEMLLIENFHKGMDTIAYLVEEIAQS